MKRDEIDLHLVAERHLHIHHLLEGWGHWIMDKPKGWGIQPMFRQYRSKSWQWHAPDLKPQGSPKDHMAVEKAVSGLPEKHREAIRWAYVWPWVPVSAVRKHLGVTREGLGRMLQDGRDMVVNRMKG